MDASIIIPAHNERERIGATIRAALAQDFSGTYEVIVVDNASTDGTADVVREFPQVHLIQESQPGVQYARERGRQQAQGEILAYLDADNLAPHDWLARGVAAFHNSRVVGVSGPYDYYDGGRLFRWLSLKMQQIGYSAMHFFVHSMLHRGGVMIGGNSLFRASALEAIGGFNTAITFYGDDTDTAMRLTRVGRVRWVPSLSVRSSARRFERRGFLRVTFLYLINFFWVTVFRKPFSNR